MPLSDPRRTADISPEVVDIEEDKPTEAPDISEPDIVLEGDYSSANIVVPIPPPGDNGSQIGLSEPQGAELILEEILEESASELFAFVEEIALGPKVTPRSNPYKQSQAVLKHINSIQQKAENFIDRFFDKLPSAAVIALRDKNWVQHRGSRSRAPTSPPMGHVLTPEEAQGAQVQNDILGHTEVGRAMIERG